ncbi:hypothetical protein V6N13_137102 [Hibiscus sabdariffa]|uniref:Uncharacterized protein n=1 Tax=Hibiscus sabdariffa TaxID=183260 RepID=A0ABR2DLM2_9ROSI
MGKKELKTPSLLQLFAVLLLLTISSAGCMAEATSRLSSSTRTREMEQDYRGDVPTIPGDYDYNDFYKRQGDVPSPGIGH